jgi:hypothetical protein
MRELLFDLFQLVWLVAIGGFLFAYLFPGKSDDY